MKKDNWDVQNTNITLSPNEVETALEQATREGKFMNFTPHANASVNATMQPGGDVIVRVVYTTETVTENN